MTTNRAIKVTGVPSQYGWHWCEIHFSKADSWALDEYTCPLLIEENIDGKVPNTDGIPKAFVDKSLQEMYEAYNKDAPKGIDLYDWLKQYARQHENRLNQNGIICRAIRQNIIAEICMPYGSNKFPEFEVWAYLQPATIGRKSTMRVIGYVCDDWPKGGWFHMQVRNFSTDPSKYEPYLSIPDETGKGFKAIRKLEWKKTTETSKTSRLHARSTVEGESAERYLIKLDVVVTNPQTPQDKARRDEAKKKIFEQIWKTNKEKGTEVSEETLKQLLRFERSKPTRKITL